MESREVVATTRARPRQSRLARTLASCCTAGFTAAILSGCLVSYDAAKPEISFRSDFGEAAVVVIERGADGEVDTKVASHSGASFATYECTGNALRVETETGTTLGRIEEPACPGWILVINADGTLDYSER